MSEKPPPRHTPAHRSMQTPTAVVAPRSVSAQAGFTLVELMVVIVIVGVLVSLVRLNIDGIDQRKAMQVREMLILDLKKINREANDQARVYALQTQASSNVSPYQYRIVEYKAAKPLGQQDTRQPSSAQLASGGTQRWSELRQFQSRELPDRVSLQIAAQQQRFEGANNSDLLGENAPSLIWFGNGEAKPVTIQVYYGQTPVGAPIQVDYLGKIDAET